MKKQLAVLALIAATSLGTLWAVPVAPSGEQAKIPQLVTQLGSANFRERDAATRELETIGEPALAALKTAAKSTDMEVANRASALVAKIEQKSANAKLLAPTYVELNLKDSTVEQAIGELSKQSGYQIILAGDRAKLGARSITIETGKVPFWKAVEILCEKANLAEGDLAAISPNDLPAQPIQPIVPLNPIRVRPIVKPLPAPLPPVEQELPPKQNVPPNRNLLPRPIVKPLPAPVEQDVPPKQDVLPRQIEQPKSDVLPEAFAADEKADEEAKRRAEDEAKLQAQKEADKQKARKALQAQIQVQNQPAQIQIQQGGVIRPIGRPQPTMPQNTIVLVDAVKAKAVPTHVEGAVRIRAIDNPGMQNNWGPVPEKELAVLLEVKAEPKMQVLQIVGTKIERATDNYDQILDQSLMANAEGVEEPANGGRQIQRIQIGGGIAQPAIEYVGGAPNAGGTIFTQARLKKGEKEAKSLKELRGVVTLRIRTPAEALVTVEKLLDAKGTTAKGKSDATVKIVGVSKEANGDVKVEVEVTHSNEVQPGSANSPLGFEAMPFQGGAIIQGNVQIQINNAVPVPVPAPPVNGKAVAPRMVNHLGIEVLDSKGEQVPLVQSINTRMQYNPNGRTAAATFTYRPKKDQEVSTLVFKGTRNGTVDVPFVLKDVVMK